MFGCPRLNIRFQKVQGKPVRLQGGRIVATEIPDIGEPLAFLGLQCACHTILPGWIHGIVISQMPNIGNIRHVGGFPAYRPCGPQYEICGQKRAEVPNMCVRVYGRSTAVETQMTRFNWNQGFNLAG